MSILKKGLTNIFNKILGDQTKNETSLGHPLKDPMAIARRQSHFAAMTGGRGFRTPPKSLKTDSEGLTRGDRKRARRTASNAAIQDQHDENIAIQDQHDEIIASRKRVFGY